MKIAISIMLALLIMGCSAESSNEAQNSAPVEAVGETSDNAQVQTDDAAQEETAPVAEETMEAADSDAVEADTNVSETEE
jgi:PBP1b-binding outer membrane lipoprotein LpoB